MQKPEPTAAYQPSEMQQITYIGENSQAKWFGSDDKIILSVPSDPTMKKTSNLFNEPNYQTTGSYQFQNAQMHTPLYASENSFFTRVAWTRTKEVDPKPGCLKQIKIKSRN